MPTEHLTLEALMEATTWPQPDVRTVGSLVTLFAASQLDRKAYDYFEARRAEAEGQPAHPWFLAAAGVFQIRLADEVSLLKRIAWVRDGMAKLDRAVEADPGFPRYLRGAAFSQLPPRFAAADQAISDLEWVLEQRHLFPPGTGRAVLRYLASAHTTAGNEPLARALLERSGHTSLDASEPVFATPYSVTAREGFRFGHEEVREAAPGVWLASGFDFTELAFVETAESLIAIDAGTHSTNARAALEAVRQRTRLQLSHLILTHSHWDHIGAAAELIALGVEVIAQARFQIALERIRGVGIPFHWFFGASEIPLENLEPDRLVARVETLEVGGRKIKLIPVAGGETEDALLVHLPESGVMFVGDVFMPYLGAPFLNEGDPNELVRTIDTILKEKPTLLLHGHRPLTDNFPIGVLGPLREALVELLDEVRMGIRSGLPVNELLRANSLPEILRSSPKAVLPYVIMRDQVIKRSYDLATGYWKADGRGIEDLADEDWARALDLVGSGTQGYVRAAEQLLKSGEAVLPLRLADLGLINHPQSRDLIAIRRRALQRLRAKNQVINPFKLIVYSEKLSAELPVLDPNDFVVSDVR